MIVSTNRRVGLVSPLNVFSLTDTPRFFRHLTIDDDVAIAVAKMRATAIGAWTLTIVRAGTES